MRHNTTWQSLSTLEVPFQVCVSSPHRMSLRPTRCVFSTGSAYLQYKPCEVQRFQRSAPSALKRPGRRAFFFPAPLPALSVENSSSFGTAARSSMSLLSCRPIGIEEGVGHPISTPPTMAEENLILAFTDNAVTMLLPCKVCVRHPDASYRRYISMARAAAKART